MEEESDGHLAAMSLFVCILGPGKSHSGSGTVISASAALPVWCLPVISLYAPLGHMCPSLSSKSVRIYPHGSVSSYLETSLCSALPSPGPCMLPYLRETSSLCFIVSIFSPFSQHAQVTCYLPSCPTISFCQLTSAMLSGQPLMPCLLLDLSKSLYKIPVLKSMSLSVGRS